MLFAIAPVRPRKGISLRVRVQGIEPNHLPQQTLLQKLGGEGKLASISVSDKDIEMPVAQITQTGEKIRFKLVFTQPALMPVAVDGWLPEGFTQSAEKNCWTGQLKSCETTIEVTIISACIGKPVKLGGWDLKQHSSTTHKAYIPAGSVYFCEAQAEDKDAILRLHDKKLGLNCHYGFGHVLVGCW
jgi:CRISPR-associated protein Cmr3